MREELRRRGLSLEESEIEGFKAYSAGPRRFHISWVDRGTVVLGDRGHVEKMLALERGKGKSARANDTLLKLYERMARDRDIAIAAIPDQATTKRLTELATRFLPEGQWVDVLKARRAGLGARLNKGVDFFVTLRFASGDEAGTLASQIKSGLERWRDHDYVVIAGLSSHLKAINVEGAGPEITASASWSERQLDAVARLAVDSLEEIMRDGRDQAATNLREKLRKVRDGGPSDGATREAGATGEAGPRETKDGGASGDATKTARPAPPPPSKSP
jgi:hypothetical protein